jgi:hypothetical protein
MVVAQVSRLNTAGHGTIRVEGSRSLRVFSEYLGVDTTAGPLPTGRQLLLAPTSTQGNRRRGVRAAAHVPRPQVQNSSSSPEPDLESL